MSKEREADMNMEAEERVEEQMEEGAEETLNQADESVEANGQESEVNEETQDTEDGASETTETIEPSAGDGTDWQEKYTRLFAEFQNYKTRTAKERADIIASGGEKVMTKILDVLDNFERAFEQGCTDQKFAEGMDNIYKQLLSVLEQNGLTVMDVLGQDFDPNFHSAAIMEDTEEYESGKISGVIQTGYMLNGKVIRPPMVKVAK